MCHVPLRAAKPIMIIVAMACHDLCHAHDHV